MANIYEGNEPFVFISYAHKNTEEVMPIIEGICARGIRAWYDAGIRPGTEWPEYIATHLDACACVVCFISAEYDASDNCQRELNYAQNLQKMTVGVYLEDCQLSSGLKMQLTLAQNLYYDRYPTVDAFVGSLIGAPEIAACGAEGGSVKGSYVRPARQAEDPAVTNLLKRAAMALEDGEWGDAAAFGQQALDLDPNNAQAYLTLLLAEMKVRKPEQLAEVAAFSEDNQHYKMLLCFADESTKYVLAQALAKAKVINFLKRAAEALERGEWQNAMTFSQQVLNLNPENAQAYLILLLAEMKVRKPEQLAEVEAFSEENKHYKKLLRFADETTKKALEKGVEAARKRAEREAAKARFLKDAKIENGVLIKYTGNESHVYIHDSVTIIGNYAFRECYSLTSVTIPDSVTRIGDDAFWGCQSLASVTIPGRVTNIGDYAFSGCYSLTSVTIPDSVTSIGDDAFWGCQSLASVTIPGSVTSIGARAFYRCSSLTSVTIRGSVTRIGEYAFEESDKLTIYTPLNSFAWGWAKIANINVLEDEQSKQERLQAEQIAAAKERFLKDAKIENGVLVKYTGNESHVYIHDSVTSIGDDAFRGCQSLASVAIPKRVTSIGEYAFRGCESLTSVTIPGSVTRIGEYAFGGCGLLTSVTIPDSVTSIGDGAFRECRSLTSVTIPNGVIRIGARAFMECKSLTSVTIPGSVTSIGKYAFWGCESLTSVAIPERVTRIGEYAFCMCKSLTSVAIPKRVTSIGEYAFRGCESLTSVTIPGSVTGIGSNAFLGCDKLTIYTPLISFVWKWARSERIKVRRLTKKA